MRKTTIVYSVQCLFGGQWQHVTTCSNILGAKFEARLVAKEWPHCAVRIQAKEYPATMIDGFVLA